ncbi:hypothetical protein E2562_008802 [Oryza meyeriana var. granulata]|uniref:F-box associated domain-containing protein n=1 Tax=Oryza meyeriana var. granulata TaxID=110450 RepID=A0A6G1D0N1_9ORYZ|nr:hypothetical protein E2562_008802 [Oryza meyeriana var. granulata]
MARARATNGRRRRGGVYAVVLDSKEGSLVFRFRRKDLFSDDDDQAPAPLVMRRFPRPVAHFPRDGYNVFHSCVVSGEHILGVSPLGATVVVDDGTGATWAGPELGTARSEPILLPVGDDMVLVMACRPLPGRMTAYMTIGGRAWVSIACAGTFSLDAGAVATRGRAAWRKEGCWELPLHGRALYVRELGAAIGLGCRAGPGGIALCLCARDVEARPPAIRQSWHETLPFECWPACHSLDGVSANLAYLGKGSAVVTMAVRLRRRSDDGELQLTKRGKLRYHLMSPHGKHAYFLQP